MTTVAQISGAIRRLPRKDLARLRKWFSEFDAVQWDREFEADVATGRLDEVAEEVRRDWRAGRTTDR